MPFNPEIGIFQNCVLEYLTQHFDAMGCYSVPRNATELTQCHNAKNNMQGQLTPFLSFWAGGVEVGQDGVMGVG